MARTSKGPYLYFRKPGPKRKGGFYIREVGKSEFSVGTFDQREAQAALNAHIAERRAVEVDSSPCVAWILSYYAENHACDVTDPARIGYAIDALLPHFGAMSLDQINQAEVNRYIRYRVDGGRVRSTAAKELRTLRAALLYSLHDGVVKTVPSFKIDKPVAKKDVWLSRKEVARMLLHLRKDPRRRHLVRFILIAVYTGTRKARILNLGWAKHPSRGHIDVERGLLVRMGYDEPETKKRAPTVPIPRRLLAHLRRWQRDGNENVVHYRGARVTSHRSAWRSMVKEIGCPDAVPHTLRHTAITWAIQEGMPYAEASSYFGVSVDELIRTYAHHRPDHLEVARGHIDQWGRTHPKGRQQ